MQLKNVQQCTHRIEASTVYFRFQYLASCKKLIKPVHTPKTQTRTVWCWALHLLHHSLIDTKPTTQTANNPVNIVYNMRQNFDQVICKFVCQCLFCDDFIEIGDGLCFIRQNRFERQYVLDVLLLKIWEFYWTFWDEMWTRRALRCFTNIMRRIFFEKFIFGYFWRKMCDFWPFLHKLA